MQSTAHQEYLAAEVFTATPQKLQLMLIDGALRQGEKAKQQLAAGARETAGEAIIKCQEIVTEILAGLNRDAGESLVRQIAGIYNFIFRRLVAAHVKLDVTALDEALALLRTERDTWQAVCDKFGSSVAAPPADGSDAGGFSLQA